MASPAVSTPSSAGSPPALAIAPQPLAMKSGSGPVAAAAATSATGIVLSKQWAIPPRPKPGRKPATDTPPTKRKAQNREAQRTFRERRAAKVGELEGELAEAKEERIRQEALMNEQIMRLEAQVSRFNDDVQSWRLRCDTLERMVDYEKREKDSALAEISYLRYGAQSTGTDAVPLPPRRARNQETTASRPQTQQQYTLQPELAALGCGNCEPGGHCSCADVALNGCGRCSAEGHCECLASIDAANHVTASIAPKRPHSPVEHLADKRPRPSDPTTPLEMDFTAQFSSKPAVVDQHVHSSPAVQILARPTVESCGFCSDGGYCMCADAAAAAANINNSQMHDNRLAPLLNEVTPPPSDTDVEGTVKLPGMHPSQMHRPVPSLPRPVSSQAPANSCVNGPGTCQQCLSDPKLGLFCRSLAAMRDSGSNAVPDGCCGGNAGGGACCKTLPTSAPSQPPPSLSVADTYKTLSTHQNFEQATDELGTWLGRLHATPPRHPGRNPMEVEAASVMGVLKLFDRRFGRG